MLDPLIVIELLILMSLSNVSAHTQHLSRNDFPPGFIFGVASSAYQVSVYFIIHILCMYSFIHVIMGETCPGPLIHRVRFHVKNPTMGFSVV